MKLKFLLKIIAFLSVAISSVAFSDVIITSPIGTELIFSDKKTGENYDPYAWKKLSFKDGRDPIDLSIKGRYFTEDGSSRVSPSGEYLVVTSISGGYLDSVDGKREYIDKAHCSVVDMKNGCFVSDWDGEVCGYNWKKNEDVLASSNSPGAETFDFLSLRPTINSIKDNLPLLNETTVRNYLRCDMPDKKNINVYQELIKVNKVSKELVSECIIKYLGGISSEKTIIKKTYLFSASDNNSRTKAYLVSGDKVKVIQSSPDNRWVNIGYINAKGTPLVAWVKADTLVK
ncbi:hypothetical protein [Rouxiella sp. Mn2063]|uniref:hypothetical protein n=1 Tax=Rouxiella sp. Mn2063 TaxID=3395262 RepID=UPI003BE0BEC4